MWETGFAIYSFNLSGRPSGTFRNPSMSSEYAISFVLYPKSSSANLIPYALIASPILPTCGIPEAPRPLSTFMISRFLLSFRSLLIISSATLSNQVPLPIFSICSP